MSSFSLLFCVSFFIITRTSAQQYTLVTSLGCNDIANTVSVTSEAGCNQGAVLLGLDDTISSRNPTASASSTRPPGCFLQVPINSFSLKVYPFAANTGDCSDSKKCVCFTAPECTHTNGLEPNNQPCRCGSGACTLGGMFCHNNKCHGNTICNGFGRTSSEFKNTYLQITSGTCEEIEMVTISRRGICIKAQQALNPSSDGSFSESNTNKNLPTGCVFDDKTAVLASGIGECTESIPCACR